MFLNPCRLEMEGDNTDYSKLVEDLGVWALAVSSDIREKIEVDAKYIRNIFDLFATCKLAVYRDNILFAIRTE